MSRPALLTNHASILGSMYYNVNELSGWMLSEPTDVEMRLYSDIVTGPGSSWIDYLNGDSIPSGYPPGPGTNALTYDNTTYKNSLSQADWEKGDWFLFGMTFLPWFAPAPDPETPGNYLRRDGHWETRYNKMRSQVLIPTAITAAKIGGVGVGVYFGSKLANKMYKKR